MAVVERISGIGTKRGVLSAAGDVIIGEGGLAGWSKRTEICSSHSDASAAAAAKTPACAQRFPANSPTAIATCSMKPRTVLLERVTMCKTIS
eukprot:COSAG05_NODE_3124_length_2306_cov_1.653829_1_plen_92_part_00